jgi:multiple antibiotic resistance protein
MLDWPEYGTLLVALWALVNPLGAAAIFLSLTENRPAERRHIGLVAAAATGIILIASALVGQTLLHAFGIDIPAFRIAGGVLILFVALAMLHTANRRTAETREYGSGSTTQDSIAVVPLAIPILAGPAAISTVIVFAQRSAALSHHLVICAVILAVAAGTWLVLRLALILAPLIGPTGMQVFTQIMGLLLAAIAVEFITQGLAAIFPAWQSLSAR